VTQQELDALPTCGGFGQRQEIRDGKTVNVPVMDGYMGPLYQGPDDVMYVRDQHGDLWTTGWAGDVLYKRRIFR
jgi:hypothetical protein